MKLSLFGRISLVCVVSLGVLLGMTACGGGTVGFMWVLAGKAASNAGGNSISGFKIDNFTGNLAAMVGSPYPSGGVNPTMAVVKPGGRFVYVVNAGDSTTTPVTTGNIQQFSVGGDGVLTQQLSYPSQGTDPIWIQISADGNFLFVLDQQAPNDPKTGAPKCTSPFTNCGDITVFSVAPDTGRLTLVTNSTTKNTDGTFITYFPVGPTPTRMLVNNGFLLVVDGDQSIFSYAIGTGGQLTASSNSVQQVNADYLTTAQLPLNITSITSSTKYVYLTDGANNFILPFTVSNGVLQSLTGGNRQNIVTGAVPTWTYTDSTGKTLYVLNQTSSTDNQAFSSISAFAIDATTGKLSPNTGQTNPYKVGSGPVCMVEDPTNKYIYTSNSIDSTVTGFEINKTTGELNDLRRGTTFSVTGKPSCLVVSGNIN